MNNDRLENSYCLDFTLAVLLIIFIIEVIGTYALAILELPIARTTAALTSCFIKTICTGIMTFY
jgi:hypothetical protein